MSVWRIPGAGLDGMALDTCGNIYVVDQRNSKLYRVRLRADGSRTGGQTTSLTSRPRATQKSRRLAVTDRSLRKSIPAWMVALDPNRARFFNRAAASCLLLVGLQDALGHAERARKPEHMMAAPGHTCTCVGSIVRAPRILGLASATRFSLQNRKEPLQ